MQRRTGSRFLASLAALMLVMLAVVFGAQTAPAQETGAVINVGPGERDFPLALPLPIEPAGDTGQAKAIWAVVERDLQMTGYFEIIDPMAYIETGGGVEPGEFDFASWRKIKAAALGKTRIQVIDGELAADVFVYDVGTGDKLIGKRFTGDAADARYLGHRIADTILLTLTGQPGLFGTRLAAVGSQSGNKEIYVMDVDGEGVRSVTRNGTINLSPAWSPDGRHIAWTSYKRGNPDLYAKDLTSGRTRVLSSREGINTGAAFSPDGAVVALARSTAGDADIYLIDAKTGADVKRLTNGAGIDVAPAYSPDGTKIAFSSERSGGNQIFVTDLASGETTRVTYSGSFNVDPVFSPDGSKIAFVGRSEGFNVFVVGADGKGMVPVTQDQGDNEDPSWSPDGRYLVFSSTRNGRSEIWMATPDGRHQVPVTPGKGGWTQPTWSPSP